MTINFEIAEVEHMDQVKKLAQEVDLPRTIAKLLWLRRVRTFDEAIHFFQPNLTQLHDPFLMSGMEKAVTRIIHALKKNEPMMIYGDYDVDGTTGASLLYLALTQLGGNVSYFIPDRMVDGYGITRSTIEKIHEKGASLIISVDCGITAVDEVDYAKEEHDLDFIICDHHKQGEDLPKAVAVLNPKRENCTYPFKDLAGCGVAFKFMQALYSRLNVDFEKIAQHLDLVALGSAADLVPLIGENRIMVKDGLNRINRKTKVGIQALIHSAHIFGQEIRASSILYNLAPRINAVGRMGNAQRAVQLLTSVHEKHAEQAAKILEEENTKRKVVEDKTYKEAISIIENKLLSENPKAFILYELGWHPGVIGIIAARVVEKYNRPTIMLTVDDEGIARGSARSTSEISIYDAIAECSDLVIDFGGHSHAAGLSIAKENIKPFIERCTRMVTEACVTQETKQKLMVDAEIKLNEINPRFVRLVKLFSPFGPQNQQPIFVSKDVKVAGNVQVIKGRHLRFNIVDDSGHTFDLMCFNLSDAYELVEQKRNNLTIIYSIEENYWRGKRSIQLRAKGIL